MQVYDWSVVKRLGETRPFDVITLPWMVLRWVSAKGRLLWQVLVPSGVWRNYERADVGWSLTDPSESDPRNVNWYARVRAVFMYSSIDSTTCITYHRDILC